MNSFSIKEFFEHYDKDKKAYFSLEEFNIILKEFQLNLDPQNLLTLSQNFDQNSKKISINQLIFFSEQFIKEDLKEVNEKKLKN